MPEDIPREKYDNILRIYERGDEVELKDGRVGRVTAKMDVSGSVFYRIEIEGEGKENVPVSSLSIKGKLEDIKGK